jgi:hypothetical protein
MCNRPASFAAAGFLAITTAIGAGAASAAPLDISWADLIPASAIIGDKVHELSGTVAHNQVTNDAESSTGGPSTSIEQLLGISSGVAYRNDLDHKDVRISGFLLPLSFSGTKVTQFLLVPFVGACIHVPAPPANQLVLVDVPQGYSTSGLWEPISVSGTLSVSGISTDLAMVGYALKASDVKHLST